MAWRLKGTQITATPTYKSTATTKTITGEELPIYLSMKPPNFTSTTTLNGTSGTGSSSSNASGTSGSVSGSMNGNSNAKGLLNSTTGMNSANTNTTNTSNGTTSGSINGSIGTSGSMNAGTNSNRNNGANGSNMNSGNNINTSASVNTNSPMKAYINLFGSNGSFVGYTGCNRIFGTISGSGSNAIHFDNTNPATAIPCFGGNDQQALLSAL